MHAALDRELHEKANHVTYQGAVESLDVLGDGGDDEERLNEFGEVVSVQDLSHVLVTDIQKDQVGLVNPKRCPRDE